MAQFNAIHIAVAAAVLVAGSSAYAQSRGGARIPIEAFIDEPMPPAIQVLGTEVDGPVFADAAGNTLYIWQGRGQNNLGYRGEQEGKPTCGDTVQRTTAGFHEPWPAGLVLPELDKRPSCAAAWPPLLADDDAKPAGKWTIVERKDGKKQWAYDGYAVYRSALDRQPGLPTGIGILRAGGSAGAQRKPIGPRPDVPAQFTVVTMPLGRLLTTVDGFSVYSWDRDGNNKSNCDERCQETFAPMLAHASAPKVHGDWGVIERSPGVYQWTYRKKPLYTLVGEEQLSSLHGSDIAGWHNVFTQAAPAFPKGFQVQDAPGGIVLADSQARTIYTYSCTDDSLDQLSCDHPSDPQSYRLAMCGGGDAARCLKTFSYVLADEKAASNSLIWSIKYVDPQTGKFADKGAPGALRVWTYRDRPVYTFFRDRAPGDTYGDSWGENNGWMNGYHAFFVREEFRKQYADTRGRRGG